jgi:hypothetical protein
LGRRQPDGAHRLPEIAQDRISSVRVKFDPYQDCFNSSGASQSEDRNDKQKTGFFDSIGPKPTFPELRTRAFRWAKSC